MDPILVFLIVGSFAMSAAISASQLLKLPEEEKPSWMHGSSGNTKVLLAGNLFGLVLIATIAYGIFHLTWWVPVACLFVTFPVIHVVILEKLLGAVRGFWLSGFIALAGTPLLWLFW
ncbi:MAG: hypothetical protein OQK12_08125 [Motiliproteus sp.]|nr:hypothetical protein [Motiliproteus sp.]MCW9051843.1 hypothetical protein [Motiliproteus sp.]